MKRKRSIEIVYFRGLRKLILLWKNRPVRFLKPDRSEKRLILST